MEREGFYILSGNSMCISRLRVRVLYVVGYCTRWMLRGEVASTARAGKPRPCGVVGKAAQLYL